MLRARLHGQADYHQPSSPRKPSVSEYLSEEEQLERLRSFWATWGIWILAGILLTAGGYAGWSWFQGHAREQAENAAALYQDYIDAGEDADRSAKALEALEDAAAGGSYHGFVLLRQASDAVNAGKLDEAEPLLRRVAEESGEPLLRSLASIRLAAVLQGQGRGDDALKLLDRVTGTGFRTAALEMKGDIHMAGNQRAEAHAAYKAAFEALEAGQKDSLLEAKVANTAAGVDGQGEAGKATAGPAVVEPPGDAPPESVTGETGEAKTEKPGDAKPEEQGEVTPEQQGEATPEEEKND
jgi:predicted negative regulator of RcsB-dependent stress response